MTMLIEATGKPKATVFQIRLIHDLFKPILGFTDTEVEVCG